VRAWDGGHAEAAVPMGPRWPAWGCGPRQEHSRDGGQEGRTGEEGRVGAQGVRADEGREGVGPPGCVDARGGGSAHGPPCFGLLD
jgi:hypothetical protein